MWHQVKSYGAVNRAVAFLFKQFENSRLNVSTCTDRNQEPVFLSKVDVDLQYPGTGVMGMGGFELDAVRDEFNRDLVDKKVGHVTKKYIYRLVRRNHAESYKNKDLFLKKAKAFYKHLLEIAGGIEANMNQSFVEGLTRDQIRKSYDWIFPIEPSNSYEHEYSQFTPESLMEMVEELLASNERKVKKQAFLDEYEKLGGTEKFALEFWQNLAGDANEVTDESKDIDKALKKYEYYRKESTDDDGSDGDSINITPQGHETRPKHERGGYSHQENDGEGEKSDVKPKKVEL